MRRALFTLLAAVLGAGLILAGVALTGKFTQDQLRENDSITLPLKEIEFPPPPDEERDLFLSEIQYQSDLPEKLNLLEDGLGPRLSSAFAKHPRVEKVERVALGPGAKIFVHVKYRTPVLAIPVKTEVRAVDVHGVLLPPKTQTQGLPVLRDTQLPPLVSSGEVWADPAMLSAARTASFLQSHQQRLHLTTITVEQKQVVLKTEKKTRVLWGRAPDEEAPTEPKAQAKLDVLFRHCSSHQDLDHPEGTKEHDLRKP